MNTSMSDLVLINRVEKLRDDLYSVMEDLKKIYLESKDKLEAERKLVFNYMFELQTSGVTNMLGADRYVQREFGFPLRKAEGYLNEYLENYAELRTKYGPPIKVSRCVSVKKPRDPDAQKKPTGIMAWNAYRKKIMLEMEAEPHEGTLKGDDVLKRATERKQADPAGYKAFCNSWLLENKESRAET